MECYYEITIPENLIVEYEWIEEERQFRAMFPVFQISRLIAMLYVVYNNRGLLGKGFCFFYAHHINELFLSR